MSKISKTQEYSKEADEFVQALVSLTKRAKQELANGFQAADIVTIVSSEFQSLIVGIQGVDQLGAEAKEDSAVFYRTLGAGLGDIAGVLLEKPVAAVPTP